LLALQQLSVSTMCLYVQNVLLLSLPAVCCRTLQRILHVDYAVPPHIKLSEDCRALLKSVLVAGVTCA
jgi:hypothetical protein